MIKFGIIGCGRIAHRHAEEVKSRGKLLAVCDIDEGKGAEFAEKYEAGFYSTAEGLFENEPSVDVIIICTPNWLHAQHTIQALKNGFHVLCEKPMALTTKDCKKMLAAAKSNNRHLFVVKQNRFNKPVVAVKKAIEKGILGKIYSFQMSCFWNRTEQYYKNSWHGKLNEDGGTLYTQFSHFIDLLYWLLGDVKELKSVRKNSSGKIGIEFEDTGIVLLLMKNGVLGTLNYSVNSYEKNMEGSLTLIAQYGTVKIGGQYLNVLEYQQIKDYIIETDNDTGKANDYGFYTGSMSSHDQVYDNIIKVLKNGDPVYMSGDEAMKTVEIIEKIYAS